MSNGPDTPESATELANVGFDSSIPIRLEPVWTTNRVNAPVELCRGPIVVKQAGVAHQGDGRIYLSWEPTPEVSFDWRAVDKDRSLDLGEVELETAQGRKFKAYVSSTTFWGGMMGDMPPSTGHIVEDVQSSSSQQLRRVLFHLPNFRDYHGQGTRSADGDMWWSSRAQLEADGWQVIIDNIASRASYDDLKATGGYAVTHVGSLEPVDGVERDISSFDEVLSLLHHFFSFCRGSWCSAQLPVGFSAAGLNVWERWEPRRTSRWKRVDSWFNALSSDGLSQLFPGFVRLYRDEMWSEPLKLAVYWYVEANCCAAGVEGSIILIQAAFELLAWTLLIEDRHLLSEDGFQKLPAMDKLRVMLSVSGIPLDLPSGFTDLCKMAKEYNWGDGVCAITEIRNGLVHAKPDKRNRVLGRNDRAVIEAWHLGLWYLELMILRICGYNGDYSDRRIRSGWRGSEVRAVPWHNATTGGA